MSLYIYVECQDCGWTAMSIGVSDADMRIQQHQMKNDGHYVTKRQL